MIETTPSEIRELYGKSNSWPEVFRALLSQMHPGNRTYLHLMNEFLVSCDIDYRLLNEIQRWSHFTGDAGYTDEELSQIMSDRIEPKAG
ncbi:hypothetical protein JIN84_05935 [Luteolibacter yonseiensis]|uniref:Uncharacterized protein n=1 Tax=Luteolibacter yonseiensis TaxID=1144680 RepID=A0A934R1P8_9BACT|nr:hypothetical protein [Luteolibacter yonseiensis]MBK1815142.1 hypothetical protein [Luteolibacter yonseiensis]